MFLQIVFISLPLFGLGVLLCFAGFRLFVMLLPVFGFFAGFLLTAQSIQQLFGGGFLVTASSWVFGFVIGILCAVAAYYFFLAAVVILAVTVGYELGVGLMAEFGVSSGFLQFLVGVIVAAVLVAAAIFFNLPKVFVVVLTAEAGSTMILTGFLLAIGRVSLAALHWGVVGAFIRDSWFWFLAFLALAAAGIAVQLFLPEEYMLTPYERKQPLRQTPSAGPPASPPPSPEPAV
jgi:hypothetical protein